MHHVAILQIASSTYCGHDTTTWLIDLLLSKVANVLSRRNRRQAGPVQLQPSLLGRLSVCLSVDEPDLVVCLDVRR